MNHPVVDLGDTRDLGMVGQRESPTSGTPSVREMVVLCEILR